MRAWLSELASRGRARPRAQSGGLQRAGLEGSRKGERDKERARGREESGLGPVK